MNLTKRCLQQSKDTAAITVTHVNKLFQVHNNPRNDKRYLFELMIQNLECSTIKSLIEIANAKTDLE